MRLNLAVLRREAASAIRRPDTARQLIVFILIGAFVFVVDTGSFQLMLMHRVTLALAATLAYALGVFTHFNLNRSLNFRNFERAYKNQAITYCVIVAFCYIVTIAVIEVSVRILGTSPLYAKIIAVAINVPISFFGHRDLTFGPGILAAVRRLQAYGDES